MIRPITPADVARAFGLDHPPVPLFHCAWCGEAIHTLKGLVIAQGVAYCCDPCYHDAKAADR